MLDPAKAKELGADIATLEVGALNPQSYEKMMILKAVKFFNELEEIGGLKSLLSNPANRTAPVEIAASYANQPRVETDSSSDFLLAVNGKDPDAIWSVLDDFVKSIASSNSKAYMSLMRRIREI